MGGRGCTKFVKMAKKTGDTGRGGSLHYTRAHSFGSKHGMTTDGVFHAGHGAVQVKVTMDNDGADRYFSHWERYFAGYRRYLTRSRRVYRYRAVYKQYSEKYNLKDIR